MADDAPIDALDAGVLALTRTLDAIAAELGPVEPLRDGDPAPIWATLAQP